VSLFLCGEPSLRTLRYLLRPGETHSAARRSAVASCSGVIRAAAGTVNDPEGWDHLDNDAKSLRPVSGTAEIDVDEIQNTGNFKARLKIPEGDLVVALDKWNEFNPCQNGGIVAYIHEHGTDSGCGDNNWPKTLVFLAGWGFGHATLNGKPLYENYEMHFMVTQGLRDRRTR
jgi:hypothetical protein